VKSLNQRQGFLVSLIAHLTLIMMILSRQPGSPTSDVPPSSLPPSSQTARVFVPPAEVLKQVLPPTALRPPAPRPVPPPPSAKDRISIGPPIPLQQKGPLILRPDDDFTKAPKGRPDVIPTPAAPAPQQKAPTPAPPVRTAEASVLPKASGTEGLRLPPGLGRDMPPRGSEGSKGPGQPAPSIASSLRRFEDKLQTGQLGIPTGSGEQQIHGLVFDPMGADFSRWITHFTREVYRNWNMPQPALMGMRGHVDIQFTVERDGSLSQCQILNSSTNIAMDKAAKYALESSRFLPLPDDYGPPSVTMRASFFYNEAPSGS